MTVHRDSAYATSAGTAAPGGAPPGGTAEGRTRLVPGTAGPGRKERARAVPAVVRPGLRGDVTDLRGGGGPRDVPDDLPSAAGQAGALRYPAGDVLVVSGLPGSGKSTLIKRAVAGLDQRGRGVRRIDSQDMRDRWRRVVPGFFPYALYRPLVRIAHYAGLRRALRSGDSVVVHDCGTLAWVRGWLARDASRRGRSLHMVLLDVEPEVALKGQATRGRGVSQFAFARHRRAVGRLVADAEGGRLPDGCASAVLLDRRSASAVRRIGFE
ncbi:AAA family ATPase [Streptomyces sp. NPDC051776]|uniref:AAA family ATPase n=1 Tax=Streptomyces sp. NPDC051776 TaxID=3155414 RepID=UPI00341825E0